MLRHRIALSLVAVVCFASRLSAQGPKVSAEIPIPSPAVYGFGGYSSTLQEGAQHGFADVLRASRENAYNTAMAACKFEDAREKSMANRKRIVQQYFELRQMNKQDSQALKTKPKPSPVAATASVLCPCAAAHCSGNIEWPVALQGENTLRARKRLESVFARRAAGSEFKLGSAEYRQACEDIDEITTQLQSSIRTTPPAEYLAARKLLTNLKTELGQPLPVQLISQS